MMTAERKPIAQVAIQSASALSKRQDDAPLKRWVCDGYRKNGNRCGEVLMELWLGQGAVRIRCPRCGTWHTREQP